MATSYIGADVDCRVTELAVRRGKRVVSNFSVPTTIPALAEVLRSIPSPKVLVIEEGSMAGWLARNLRKYVDELIVCDPRRNRLIVDDGDKDNPIDAAKLSELAAGGHLRAVYHNDDETRVLFKEWVSLYHDRVVDAVRQINKIRGRCRMHGVWPPRGALRNPRVRGDWLKRLEPSGLAGQLELLFMGYDVVAKQVDRAKKEICRRAKPYEIIQRWQEVSGIGPIRAITFFVYMDTPMRFSHRKKRWKYCGVGLVRNTSGTDKRGRAKPGLVHVELAANRRLKNTVLGGATSAIGQGNNVLSDKYHWLRGHGVSHRNARRTVARKLIDKMVAMWVTGEHYAEDVA